MHSPLVAALARTLSRRASESVAWVRFNFRGVGASEGQYDGGRGELDDALAVVDYMTRRVPGVPVTMCGHSFGAWVAFGVASQAGRESRIDRTVLFGPSARLFEFVEPGAEFRLITNIFLGSEDEYCDVAEARELGRRLGAERVEVMDGFDHQFLQGRHRVAELALSSIAPEVTS